MIRLACVAIGYVFGLFQTGYIYGELKGTDIRQHGSGNAGATNALRTLGWKAGLITLLGDCFKCVFAVFLVRALFAGRYPDENMGVLLGMYAALGVILGHNFPFYLKFKGGKGIAATAGLYLSLDPVMTLVAIVLFGGAVGATPLRIPGIHSGQHLAAVGTILFGQQGHWGLSQGHLYELYAITIFLCLMAIYRHRKNIGRLLNGTESKLGQKAK